MSSFLKNSVFSVAALALFLSHAHAVAPNRIFGESCALSPSDQTTVFLAGKPELKALLAAQNIHYTTMGMSWATIAGARCSSFILKLDTETDRAKLRSIIGDFYKGLPVVIDVDAEPVITQ